MRDDNLGQAIVEVTCKQRENRLQIYITYINLLELRTVRYSPIISPKFTAKRLSTFLNLLLFPITIISLPTPLRQDKHNI